MTLPTTDGLGALDVYRAVPTGVDADPALAQMTVVYSHGNYGSIEHYIPRIRALAGLGVTVVFWDYRGFGKSLPASPGTSEQMIDDSRLVLDWAVSQATDSAKVVPYGYSLGGISAIEMAHYDATLCGLVVESPFTSMRLITQSSTGLAMGERFFSEGRFDGATKLEQISVPMLAMAAGKDDKFPPSTVEEMLESAAGPVDYWLVDEAFHGVSAGGIPESRFDEYQQRLEEYLLGLPCNQVP